MKIRISILLVLLIIACQPKKGPIGEEIDVVKDVVSYRVVRTDFQAILDSAIVSGVILIQDLNSDSIFSNNFSIAKKGKLPASTFKVPNSIIALELGIVEDDSTILPWNGEKRRMKIWEQDLTFKQAFHYSCVPCYQEIARKIGVDSMKAYLDKFEYSIVDIDSSNIEAFWLEGETKVNALTQVSFMKDFYEKKLPISSNTYDVMKELMVIEESNDYTLSGKTGWAIREGNNIGWFIGHVKTSDMEYVFATNIEPRKGFDMNVFPAIRKEVIYKSLDLMGVK